MSAHHPIRRPHAAVIALLAGLLVLAAACGSSSKKSSSGATPSGPSTSAGGETGSSASASAAPPTSTAGTGKRPKADLVIWADGNRAPVLQKLGNEFGKANGITVAVQTVDFAQLVPNFEHAAPVGEGPDIIVTAHDTTGELIKDGLVDPIDLGKDASNYVPSSIAAFTQNGKLYGLPYAVEAVGLYTNTKLVKKPPTSWAQLVSEATTLKKAGKVKPAIGLPMGSDGNAYQPYGLVTASGGYLFKKSGTGYDQHDVGIDNAGGLKFAQSLTALCKQGLMSVDVTSDIAKQAFIKGKVPFLLDGPWQLASFDAAKVPYAVTPIPPVNGGVARPFVGVQGFIVSHFSKNSTLAKTFLVDYLNGPGPMRALYDVDKRPPALNAVAKQVETNPAIKGFLQAAANGEPTPSIPAMTSVWKSWGQAYVLDMSGRQDPATAFKNAAKQIRIATKKN